MNKQQLTLAYNKLKKQLDTQRDSETLKKFEILNKAYEIGKKLHGAYFTAMRLSIDFELPYTTTKRILSLRKANKTTWDLIKSKKVSVFKVAMVLCLKEVTYQDEIIQMVIKNNLSTYDIKSLRIENYKDIKKERLRIAVEKGFARQETAYNSFYNTLKRMNELLNLEKIYLPEKKIDSLKKELKNLKERIEEYLNE